MTRGPQKNLKNLPTIHRSPQFRYDWKVLGPQVTSACLPSFLLKSVDSCWTTGAGAESFGRDSFKSDPGSKKLGSRDPYKVGPYQL